MKMKTLVILEVSRKQDYIFSSKQLRDNVRRSDEISIDQPKAHKPVKGLEII